MTYEWGQTTQRKSQSDNGKKKSSIQSLLHCSNCYCFGELFGLVLSINYPETCLQIDKTIRPRSWARHESTSILLLDKTAAANRQIWLQYKGYNTTPTPTRINPAQPIDLIHFVYQPRSVPFPHSLLM